MRYFNSFLILTAVLICVGCSEDTDDQNKQDTPEQISCAEQGQTQCGSLCCSNGQLCINNVCQNQPVTQDACIATGGIQCGNACCTNGQICLNGFCQNQQQGQTECTGNGESKCGNLCCQQGQVCINGQCQDDLPVETECTGEGETKCGDVCCNNGQSCVDGQCQDDLPVEKECTGDGETKCGDVCCSKLQKCVNNQCQSGIHIEDKCTGDGETKCGDLCCSKGQICFDNTCKDSLPDYCFKFTDPEVENYALSHWDTNKDGCMTDDEVNAVTEIPSEAFKNNTDLQSIEDLSKFPNIAIIGSKAFADTNHLAGKAYFPHVTKVKIGAFWISGIEEVDFPEWEIAEPKTESSAAETGQFYKCQKLKKVNLPKLKTATSSLFSNCTSLQEVDLPSVIEIQNIPFAKCTALKKIKLTALGTITLQENSWKDFSTVDADIVLNSDKKAGGSGAPLVSGTTSWADATWKSISFK